MFFRSAPHAGVGALLNAMLFCGAVFTLKDQRHARVDVIGTHITLAAALIDLFGTIVFLRSAPAYYSPAGIMWRWPGGFGKACRIQRAAFVYV